MSSIKKQEKALFKKWEVESSNFVKDGVISERDYRSANQKVLLILKEANDEGGGGWDLRDHVRNRPRSQTWNTVTRWMIGISQLDKRINWQDLKSINEADRKHHLRSIAVMNLKKTPGGGASKSSQIKSSALKHRDLLNKQFKLYNPDIVVCGGTGKIVKEVIELGGNPTWQYTRRGIHYCKFSSDQVLFRYFHPQSRYPGMFKYYGLIDAIKEVCTIKS